jgi:hypothetical protein
VFPHSALRVSLKSVAHVQKFHAHYELTRIYYSHLSTALWCSSAALLTTADTQCFHSFQTGHARKRSPRTHLYADIFLCTEHARLRNALYMNCFVTKKHMCSLTCKLNSYILDQLGEFCLITGWEFDWFDAVAPIENKLNFSFFCAELSNRSRYFEVSSSHGHERCYIIWM